MYTFPDDSKLTMAELVDKAKTTIVITKTCHITGVCVCICVPTYVPTSVFVSVYFTAH